MNNASPSVGYGGLSPNSSRHNRIFRPLPSSQAARHTGTGLLPVQPAKLNSKSTALFQHYRSTHELAGRQRQVSLGPNSGPTSDVAGRRPRAKGRHPLPYSITSSAVASSTAE